MSLFKTRDRRWALYGYAGELVEVCTRKEDDGEEYMKITRLSGGKNLEDRMFITWLKREIFERDYMKIKDLEG